MEEAEVTAGPCPVHDGQIHGGEAEELRKGLERLIADRNVSARSVQRLLDEVDARDSLGYLERVRRNRRRKTGRS